MNRAEKRKEERALKTIVDKAKEDMADFIAEWPKVPTEIELMIWQRGYLAGINRMENEKD